jgi:septal ring factor EnvC (AmiA/AmiB activator)
VKGGNQNMFDEQIKALTEKEDSINDEIVGIEESLKKKKAELAVVKRAKKSLESAQESLNGQVTVSE